MYSYFDCRSWCNCDRVKVLLVEDYGLIGQPRWFIKGYIVFIRFVLTLQAL